MTVLRAHLRSKLGLAFRTKVASRLESMQGPGMRKELVFLVVILLLAFALRLSRLEERGIWYDDAFSIFLAERRVEDIVLGTTADTMPPLYYVLLHFWMCLGEELFILRFLSVTLSLLIIPLTYLVASKLFGAHAGLYSAFFAAISPFQIYHAQELRMYGLLCLTGLAYVYSFSTIWLRRRPGSAAETPSSHSSTVGLEWRSWIALIVTGALNMYAHNLAFLTLVVPNLVAIINNDLRLLKRLILAQTAILVLFAPWLLLLPQQLAKIQRAFWTPRPGLVEVIQTLMAFTFNQPLPSWLFPLALYAGVAIFSLIAYETARELKGKSPPSILFILLLILIPPAIMFCVSYLMRPIYVPRGVIVSSVACYILAAKVLAKIRRPVLVVGVMTPVVALTVVALSYYYYYDEFPRSPFKETMAYLRQEKLEGDAVVHDNKLSYFPSHYYYRELEQYFIADVPGSPNDTLAPDTMQAMGIYPTTLQQAIENHERFWLVVFQRALDEAEEVGEPNANKAWLDNRYRLTSTQEYNDLNIYLYESS